jgi:hypothetical protein
MSATPSGPPGRRANINDCSSGMIDTITRSEAIASGAIYYFTGIACKRGHIAKRLVSNYCCVECARERIAANPGARKRACRKYYASNKAAISKRARDRHQRDKEKRKRACAKYYQAHKSEARARNDKWQANNPSKTKAWKAASARKWAREHPAERKAQDHKRRAAKLNCGGYHTAAEAREIKAMQKNKCAYCKADLGKKGHLDHITPLSKGGSNHARNIQWLCEACNCSKGAKDPIEFARKKGMLL